MPRPKVGGYTHRRLVGELQRDNAQARKHLQFAHQAHSAQAQATLLCSCALALARVSEKLAEIQALLDDPQNRTAGD